MYRATNSIHINGFRGSYFHSKCDDRPNTLTLFKASGSSFIFVGFTLASWESCDTGKFKSDPNAFLFSLTNKDNQPCKMKIDQNKHQHAIYCRSYRGPSFGDSIFGAGRDIHIVDRANAVKESYSNLGYTYKHPQYAYGTKEAQTFLAGSQNFDLAEIEVYQKQSN